MAEPLIVFPFEKERACSSATSFVFDNYVRNIWGHQKQQGNAEILLQGAKQIRVIGYSFDPNDRKAIINLLRKSEDSSIIIQNLEPDPLCKKLALEYPDLEPRLRPFAMAF